MQSCAPDVRRNQHVQSEATQYKEDIPFHQNSATIYQSFSIKKTLFPAKILPHILFLLSLKHQNHQNLSQKSTKKKTSESLQTIQTSPPKKNNPQTPQSQASRWATRIDTRPDPASAPNAPKAPNARPVPAPRCDTASRAPGEWRSCCRRRRNP